MQNQNTISPTKQASNRIHGTQFLIDEHGFVSTADCGQIGHLEECVQVAQAFHELFAIGDEIHAEKTQ